MSAEPISRRRPALLTAALLVAGLLAAGCGAIAKPQGWAAPAVREETVITSHNAGKLGAYRLSGQGRIWEFPGNGVEIDLSGIYGNPVVQEDTVYFGGYGGNVVALNAGDGSERWRHKAGSRVIGGVLVTADTVYAGTDAGDLVALDRANGNERWRQRAGREIWSAPVTDGSTIFIASMDGRITAYAPDGTRRWQAKVANAAIAGTPALRDGVLYVGAYDRRLYAVDAQSGETRWRSAAADNWFWTEPLIDGDTVFAGNMDGRVYAVDRQSGEQRWQKQIGSPVRARLAVQDGVLLVPANDGVLRGLRPQTGEQAWEPVTIGGRLYADLVTARNTVFLAAEVGKDSHRLYRVDAAQGNVAQINLN